MSATVTGMLNAARSQLGYREGPNNASKYGAWYGLDNQPYCAMGLSWAAAHAGAADIVHGRWCSCPKWMAAFQRAGEWHPHPSSPAPGDIVFFDWNARHAWPVHVGIVERVESGDLVTIEFNTVPGDGNQSDGGGVYRRRRSTRWVVGYGRPRYARQIPPPSRARTLDTRLLPLAIDGAWGPKTTARLQRWLGVDTTGQLDGATRRRLQARLGVEVDGDWGPITRRALQRMLGVETDGVWGPITVRALQRWLNRVV